MYQDDFVILIVTVISELLYFGPGMTFVAANSRLVCIMVLLLYKHTQLQGSSETCIQKPVKHLLWSLSLK